MINKYFFDENDEWTEDVAEFCDLTRKALSPIIKDFLARGYSIRDLTHSLLHSVVELEIKTLIERRGNG
jgi:hypothetical protein